MYLLSFKLFFDVLKIMSLHICWELRTCLFSENYPWWGTVPGPPRGPNAALHVVTREPVLCVSVLDKRAATEPLLCLRWCLFSLLLIGEHLLQDRDPSFRLLLCERGRRWSSTSVQKGVVRAHHMGAAVAGVTSPSFLLEIPANVPLIMLLNPEQQTSRYPSLRSPRSRD